MNFGSVVTGEITTISELGLFIKTNEGREALAHRTRVVSDFLTLKTGDTVEGKVENSNYLNEGILLLVGVNKK